MSALDVLADVILARSCSEASPASLGRLVGILDAGAAGAGRSWRPQGASERFSQACLRKLYVVSGRGDERVGSSKEGLGPGEGEEDAVAVGVARASLPVLMARCGASLEVIDWIAFVELASFGGAPYS